MKCFECFSWLPTDEAVEEHDVVKVHVVEVDMDPKALGERWETLIAVLPPEWLYFNKLYVRLSFPNGDRLHIYPDGAVILFRPGWKEGRYLYRPE